MIGYADYDDVTYEVKIGYADRLIGTEALRDT